jgi:hypothetical protein
MAVAKEYLTIAGLKGLNTANISIMAKNPHL